jgi:kinesin family protein 18/19
MMNDTFTKAKMPVSDPSQSPSFKKRPHDIIEEDDDFQSSPLKQQKTESVIVGSLAGGFDSPTKAPTVSNPRRWETLFSGTASSSTASVPVPLTSTASPSKVSPDLPPAVIPRPRTPISSGEDSGEEETNEPPTPDGRMRVFVRVRPENDKELRGNATKIVEPIDKNLLVFDPVYEEEEFYYQGKTYKEPGKKQPKNTEFRFHRIFDEESSNTDVFSAVTKQLIDQFLKGYNCAVFAYGATGSGKTHTMLGSPEDPGVIFYTTMHLYNVIESRSDEEQLELSISYFEIYNEVVRDLLTPAIGNKSGLAVREDPKRGVIVKNLSVHQPKDAQHLLDMLEYGNGNRTQHPTDANAESSRSHAVFQIFLKKSDYSSAQEMSIQLSKMSLIDLAGSERASVAYKTNRNKSVQREGSNINKSLLALGNCINALARRDPKKKQVHINYRDSKLTLLMKDSLGGSCHTAMIAAVSPSSLSYEDTHNTLVYANRAKGIQNQLTKNNVQVGLQPRNYNQALDTMSKKVSDLQEENNFLKSELNRLKSEMSKQPKNPITIKENSLDTFNEVKNRLDMLFKDRASLRRQILDAESNLRKLDLKLILRKIEKERMESLGSDRGDDDKDSFGSLHTKKLHYIDVKSNVEEKLKENAAAITQIEKDLQSKVGPFDWFLEAYFKDANLQQESKDVLQSEKHAIDISKTLVKRLEANEELVLEQADLLRYSHNFLGGIERLSEELDDRFTALQRKAEGKKSVVWRDDESDPILKTVTPHELQNVYHLGVFRANPKEVGVSHGMYSSPRRIGSRKSRQLTSVHCMTPDMPIPPIDSGTVTKGTVPSSTATASQLLRSTLSQLDHNKLH